MGAIGSFASIFLFVIPIYLAMIAYLVITYILQSKAMYAIAQRRGIENPWMAWVPFCNSWMLGAISDQYQQAVWGDVTNRRKSLLIWHIVFAASVSIYMISCVIYGFGIAAAGDEDLVIVLVLFFLFAILAFIAVSVVYLIQYYKALFDLFRSSDPDRSMLYLMLSIFVQFPAPFFMYACRNKDDGMPAAPAQIPEIT